MNSISDIHVFTVPKFLDRQGYLVAFDAKSDLKISLRRVFVVSGHSGDIRGKHAHKSLTQILVCVHGACRVTCDDGMSKKEVTLDRPDIVLEIPPGIWADQYYYVPDSVLMVMCDLPYDESDYIRNYDDFIAFRKEKKP